MDDARSLCCRGAIRGGGVGILKFCSLMTFSSYSGILPAARASFPRLVSFRALGPRQVLYGATWKIPSSLS